MSYRDRILRAVVAALLVYAIVALAGQYRLLCRTETLTRELSRRHEELSARREELTQLLVPALETPKAQAVIEYSEAEARAVLTVRYNGKPFDLPGDGEGLSRTVLKGIAADIRQTAPGGGAVDNRIDLTLTE